MAEQSLFDELVGDEPNMVGALAYALYKRHKRDFIESYLANNGHLPSAQELEAFSIQCMLPGSIAGFRERARVISTTWVSKAIRKRAKRFAAQTKNSALAKHLESAVQRKLDERRTWTGWLREAGTSLIANTLALLLVRLLGFGVKLYDVFNTKVERVVEIQTPAHSSGR